MSAPQQPYGQQPGQQPYGQQPYGQQPGQPVYGQPGFNGLFAFWGVGGGVGMGSGPAR